MNLLIKKARKHDKAAFQQLMEQQGKGMYKVAKAILKNDEDVADAMQETALACWEKIGTLKKDRYFQTWLTRILINNCNAIYRQRGRMAAEEHVPESWYQEDGYAAVGPVVCFSNPALAAKLPFIGSIFREVQEEIPTFTGIYDDKAEVLYMEGSETAGNADSAYTANDGGVTVTASEIYCDGLSVFLTAEVNVEQGRLEQTPSGVMYLDGDWKIAGDINNTELVNNNLQGKALDDHTFIGMLKLDLDDMKLPDGMLELRLSMVGYDDVNELDAEKISAFHKIEGEWNLTLPFTVDTEAVRNIPVNMENQGYCLRNVFVSPFQVITYTDVPYEEREITREEYEKMVEEKGEGLTDDIGISYEDYVEQAGKTYAHCDTLVFNQDGVCLTPTEEFQGHSVNAVQGAEISKLYIYIFDDFDAWIETMHNGMDSDAAKQALIFAEVDVK